MIIPKILAIFGLLATAAHGHISLAEPVPYGKPDTSPLSASGSNYPCKTDNGFDFTTMNDLAVGQEFPVSFSGSAVHGGGSCQLSLTPTLKPDTNSVFRVIFSIEGGCPGTDGGTVSYNAKVPAEVPNGNYSLAWSWANKVGNREYYMNCAPVSITGSSQKDDTAYNNLPEMAIFNIPSKSACTTLETFDVQYFDPGNYKETGSAFLPHAPAGCGAGNASTPDTSSPDASLSGNSGQYTSPGNSGQYTSPAGSSQTGSPGSQSGSGYSPGYSPGSSSGSSSASQYGSSTGSQYGSSGNYTAPYGSSANTTSGSAPSTVSTSILYPATAAAPTAVSTASSSGGSASSAAPAAPAAPASAGSVACSTEGALVCDSTGTKFGLCDHGLAVWQAVAAGTACVSGKIDYAVPPRAKFRARARL